MWKIYLYAMLAMVFWGLSFVWIKMAFVYYGPLTVVFLRVAAATLILGIILKVSGKGNKIARGDFRYFLLLAFFEPFCYFLGESFGMLYVSSTLASVIIATIPLFTPFVAYFLLKERLTIYNVLGLLVSFVGILLMVSTRGFAFEASPRGVLLMFFAVAAALGFGALVRILSLRYNSITIIAWQNAIGTVLFLPLFLTFEAAHFVTIVPTLELVATMIQLTVFPSILAFFLFIKVVRVLGLTKATVFTNIIPLITAAAAYFMLQESFTQQKVAGMFVVVVGLALSQKRARPSGKL